MIRWSFVNSKVQSPCSGQSRRRWCRARVGFILQKNVSVRACPQEPQVSWCWFGRNKPYHRQIFNQSWWFKDVRKVIGFVWSYGPVFSSASVCGWSMSLYFFPRFLLLASLQLSDKMPKRINPYWFNGSLERNICQLFVQKVTMLIFPPHATLPHLPHLPPLTFTPKQPGFLLGWPAIPGGCIQRAPNHSPSQGSHEENPKMISLLQINITRCHSLPPDQLCLVIETSRIAFFVWPPPFFKAIFFPLQLFKELHGSGWFLQWCSKMFETSVDQTVRALPKELEEEFLPTFFGRSKDPSESNLNYQPKKKKL